MVFVWLRGEVGRGGPALPYNSSQQPALFVPSGPPYLPVAAASTHHSLTRTQLHLVSVHCLFDLHTVHLTKTASVAKVKMEQSSTDPVNSY